MAENDERGEEGWPEPDEYYGSEGHLERLQQACEDARPNQFMRFTGWSNKTYSITPEEILAIVDELSKYQRQDEDNDDR